MAEYPPLNSNKCVIAGWLIYDLRTFNIDPNLLFLCHVIELTICVRIVPSKLISVDMHMLFIEKGKYFIFNLFYHVVVILKDEWLIYI